MPAYYILTHKPTGMYYIGSTSNLIKRLSRHKSALNSRSHECAKLQEIYTCWEDIEIVSHEVGSIEEARRMEQDLLNTHFRKSKCCNTSSSAEPFGDMTAEDRSNLHRGHKYNLGKAHSDETKAKIGAASLGRTKSPEVRQKIAAAKSKKVSIDGTVYDSIKDAAYKLNLPYMTVSGRLKSTRYTAWFYIE